VKGIRGQNFESRPFLNLCLFRYNGINCPNVITQGKLKMVTLSKPRMNVAALVVREILGGDNGETKT